MIQLDFSGLNIPLEVQEKLKQDIENKAVELVTKKATIISNMTIELLSKVPSIAEKMWSENEIAFLQNGTTREEVSQFSKQLLIKMFSYFMENAMKDVEEDIM